MPEVNFAELGNLSPERVKEIRDKGCLVIRDIVDDQEARTWQAWLREYVSKNPVAGRSTRSLAQSTKLTLFDCSSAQASQTTTSSSSRSSARHLFLAVQRLFCSHVHFQLGEVADSRALAPERPLGHDVAEQDVSHQERREG